jgi:hypothetical protein
MKTTHPFVRARVRVLLFTVCLGAAAIAGYFLETPFAPWVMSSIQQKLVFSFIAVALSMILWSVFCLIEPRQHGVTWVVLKCAGTSLIWLAAYAIFAVWFYHLHMDWVGSMFHLRS